MNKIITVIIFTVVVSFFSIKDSAADKTEEYLDCLKTDKFRHNGADYTNEKYSPLRLNKDLEKIDNVYDYDFNLLSDTEESLRGIERKIVLRRIFDLITVDAKTNTEKHIAVLKFLQESSYHNPYLQPIYQDKTMVYDPLVLLELNEMRCGQVARIAVDIFKSVGYDARLVQLGGHVIAEVFYDDSWHYFDADVFGNGMSVIVEDGKIPSVVELSANPYLIDSLPSIFEAQAFTDLSCTSIPYLSYNYFNIRSYKPNSVLYYNKIATKEQEQNKLYGWNYYVKIKDNERVLYDAEPFYQPSAVNIKDVSINKNKNGSKKVHIEWTPAIDKDNDLLGYKVYISNKSRGWDRKTWKPEMYENLFEEPPYEICLTQKETFVDMQVLDSDRYYITIMPYDAHGESVGRKLYFMSDEVKI